MAIDPEAGVEPVLERCKVSAARSGAGDGAVGYALGSAGLILGVLGDTALKVCSWG